MGMVDWIQSRFNNLLDNLIFAAIWTGGSAMAAILKALPIPVIIGISVAVFVTILFLIKVMLSFHIKYVVKKLLSVGIYTDAPVNITRILYYHREELAVGLPDDKTSIQDKSVLGQLNLRNIVQLEQRKTGSYWILTELGKRVILYLQKNQQVLDKEGSLSQ